MKRFITLLLILSLVLTLTACSDESVNNDPPSTTTTPPPVTDPPSSTDEPQAGNLNNTETNADTPLIQGFIDEEIDYIYEYVSYFSACEMELSARNSSLVISFITSDFVLIDNSTWDYIIEEFTEYYLPEQTERFNDLINIISDLAGVSNPTIIIEILDNYGNLAYSVDYPSGDILENNPPETTTTPPATTTPPPVVATDPPSTTTTAPPVVTTPAPVETTPPPVTYTTITIINNTGEDFLLSDIQLNGWQYTNGTPQLTFNFVDTDPTAPTSYTKKYFIANGDSVTWTLSKGNISATAIGRFSGILGTKGEDTSTQVTFPDVSNVAIGSTITLLPSGQISVVAP